MNQKTIPSNTNDRFLILGGRPSLPSFIQAALMPPMILVLAAVNAFNEEMT